MGQISLVAKIVSEEAAARGGYSRLAAELDTPYHALYQLGTGRRVRSVSADLLLILISRMPRVAAIFSQPCETH